MEKKDTKIKARFDNPVSQLRRLQMEYRAALNRAWSQKDKKAFLRLVQDKERDALMKKYSSPIPPAVPFYRPPSPPPPSTPPSSRRQNSSSQEQQIDGPYLTKEDFPFIGPIGPPQTITKTKHEYIYAAHEYFEDIPESNRNQVECEQRGEFKSIYVLAVAHTLADDVETLAQVRCGFYTEVDISDGPWAYVGIASRLNSALYDVQLDTRTYYSDRNPTYVNVKADQVVEVSIGSYVVACESKPIFSHEITGSEESFAVFNESVGTEILAGGWIWGRGAGKLLICDALELTVESDGFARFNACLTWDIPLEAWWEGRTLLRGIKLPAELYPNVPE
jgi:hypothetical protein